MTCGQRRIRGVDRGDISALAGPTLPTLLGLSVWLANTIVGPIGKDVGYTALGALQRVVATAVRDS